MFADVLLGASGGIVGVLGALFKHGLEIWQEKKRAESDLLKMQAEFAHEEIMADKRASEMQFEAENAIKLANIKAESDSEKAGFEALTTSLEADKATYSNAPASPWLILVDVVRGLTRPVLTAIFSFALLIFTASIWSDVPVEVTQSPEFLTATFYRLIDALIFLSTSAAGWWFAARAGQAMKGRE